MEIDKRMTITNSSPDADGRHPNLLVSCLYSPIDCCSNPAAGGPNSSIDEAIDSDHDNAYCRPGDDTCDFSYIFNFRLTNGIRKIKAMSKVPGCMLMLLANLLVPRALAFVNDCQPNQLYDTQRLVCLDLCGRDNELTCGVENFCSSNQLWSKHFDPPFCLNRCIQRCDTSRYCNHDIAECRKCDDICDDSDMDACRAYCYDVFVNLPTTTPQPAWEPCNDNQYYDLDRKLCLDRCGADDEEKCGVHQFCSTTVHWGVEIHPPACLNHCPHPCGGATYCESTSHQCLPCADLCGDTNTDLCRKHCFDVFMNVTSLDPPTANYSVPITPTNTPVLSTDIITSVIIYQVTLGVLSAMIIALIGALVMKHYWKRSSQDGERDIETLGSAAPFIKV